MDEAERTEKLREIRDEVLALKESPLYAYRTESNAYPVIGEGSHFAKIMLIGEAPGKNEAMTGRPFCGASGKVLDELLHAAAIERESVYVTNIVKDRPPENRDPFPSEIEMYGPFLDRQIEIIRPAVIGTLGRFSMEYIMRRLELDHELQSISKIHGHQFEGKTSYGTIAVIPLYHPAVAVYDRSKKDELIKDFVILSKFNK